MKKGTGGRRKGLGRRFLAGLLSLTTALTLLAPGGGGLLIAQAATELQPETLPATESTDNMEATWQVSGDFAEETVESNRYNMSGINSDNTRKSITFGNYGVPLYLVMPVSNVNNPFLLVQMTGGYDPTVLVSNAGNQFYMAKLGQRSAELSAGNALPAGQNQAMNPLIPKNGAVETTRFGGASDHRTVESMVKTSTNGKYMIADYYFYGREDIPASGQDFYVAMAYDFQVNDSLHKDMVVTDRGFYARKYGENSTVNVILKDDNLGVTAADSKWIGYFNQRIQRSLTTGLSPISGYTVTHTIMTLAQITGKKLHNADYSISYSWKIRLHPGETIHKRVAYTYTEAAIYISSAHGNDAWNGNFDAPVKTFAQALQLSQNKNATIFIEDYNVADSGPMVIGSGAGTGTLTITSADITRGGTSIGFGQGTQVIQSPSGSTAALFENNQSARPVTIDDLTFQGNGSETEPLLKNSSSAGVLNLGAKLTVTGAGNGALDIKGGMVSTTATSDAESSMPVTITGNKGYLETVTPPGGGAAEQKKRGAVSLQGGSLKLAGAVNISGNTMEKPSPVAGAPNIQEPKNLYVKDGLHVDATAPLRSGSTVGFTTEKLPDPNQQIETIQITGQPGNAACFTKDEPSAGVLKWLKKDASGQIIGVGLEARAQKVERVAVDLDGNPIAHAPAFGGTNPEDLTIGATFSYAASTVPGHYQTGGTDQRPKFIANGTEWLFDSIVTDPSNKITAAQMNATTGAVTDAEVPEDGLKIYYRYKKNIGKVKFEGNGGTPSPITLSGSGSTTGTTPVVSRYGYKITKWTLDQAGTNPSNVLTVNPATGQAVFTFESGEKTYYAQWEYDTSITFDLNAMYSNADGSINFQTLSPVTTPIGSTTAVGIKHIHGYQPDPSQTLSVITPQLSTSGTSPEAAWELTGTPRQFKIYHMPGQDTTVDLHYVLGTAESDKSDFAVEYYSGTAAAPGALLKTDTPVRYFPETAIAYTVTPPLGYDVADFAVIDGNVASTPTTPDNLVNAIRDADLNGNQFTAIMPNQNVKIRVYCTPNGTGVPLVVDYRDAGSLDTTLQVLRPQKIETKPIAGADSEELPEIYGYYYGSNEPAGAVTPATGVTGSFQYATAPYSYNYTMPSGELDLLLTYHRDPSKWVKLTYLPGNGGTLGADPAKVSPDVHAGSASGSYEVDVTKQGASAVEGYSFAEVKTKRLVPTVTATDAPYYRFKGFIVNDNGNGVLDSGEHLVADNEQFPADTTLTACYEEDPAYWIDILFAPYDSNTIQNPGALLTAHLKKDKLWGDALPTASLAFHGIVNYVFDGWYDLAGHKMALTDTLENGGIYRAKYVPDPLVFGLPARGLDASGSLDSQGKGRVTAYDTKPGYKYILTDLDGHVVDVQNGTTGRTYFDNKTPGTRYKVYEATGDVAVNPGDDITNVIAANPAAPNSRIGDPTEVLIPVVETNYQVTYDPTDETEGSVVLTIDPADRDADYALIDASGNVVTTPETQADGWQAGTPGAIHFSGLRANETYTVVARPHGRNDITVLSRLPDGTQLLMAPAGEIEIPKFSITTTDGESRIDSVNGAAIGAAYFDEAHAGEAVVLTAPAVNSAGETFKTWRVTTGQIPGINSQLGNATLNFTMPDTNLVMTAYYERNLNGNAPVEDEVRGGNPGEMALDPNALPGLESALTTPDDQVLMQVNHADVRYKIVYNKRKVPASTSNALKNDTANIDAANHPAAFTAAFEVQTNVERYVNGRLVNTPSNATPRTFPTYVQLSREDVNNLDYQLVYYDASTGSFVPMPLNPADPYASGGLFQFTATEGVKYYLVYSKAFKLTFVNERNALAPWPHYSFLVRRGEAPEDADYTTFYNTVENDTPSGADVHQVDTATGVEYDWKGWSRRADRRKTVDVFDPSAPIRKRTIIYGYWENNKAVLDQARTDLDDAIRRAQRLADDFFLKRRETADLLRGVPGQFTGLNEVIAFAERTNPRPTAAEIAAKIAELEHTIAIFEAKLNPRYANYGAIQNNRLSGGTGGGGGRGNGNGGGGGGTGRGRTVSGGSLSTAGGPSLIGREAFIADYEPGYTVGTNGNWQLVNPEHAEWIFTLNGGIRLVGRWAKLDYANGDRTKNGWYHFNSHGIMDFGWFKDEKGDWYYCNTEHDGWLGKMQYGWHFDEVDKHWYYLDSTTGVMLTGWQEINGKWYYFTPETTAYTYEYDAVNEKWFYKAGNTVRPHGSMYVNETTPDGYRVDANGAWQR